MKHGVVNTYRDGSERVSGHFYVVPDAQRRFSDGGYVVIQEGDGTALGDTVQRGLFWKAEDAELFCATLKAGLQVLDGRSSCLKRS